VLSKGVVNRASLTHHRSAVGCDCLVGEFLSIIVGCGIVQAANCNKQLCALVPLLVYPHCACDVLLSSRRRGHRQESSSQHQDETCRYKTDTGPLMLILLLCCT